MPRSGCQPPSQSGKPRGEHERAGFTLLEVSVAGFLLVILMAVSVQVLGWAAAERVAVERRQWAIGEAANIMERLANQPWEELTPEAAAEVEVSPQARDVLPDCEFKIEVASEPGQSSPKRITVQLGWQRRSGQPAAPVRVSSWVYRRGGTGE